METVSNWAGHSWRVPGGERIEVLGKTRRRFECTLCRRAFIEGDEGRRWAINQYQKVNFGEIGEYDAALEETVSKRWLSEACPRQFVPTDDDDRRILANGSN